MGHCKVVFRPSAEMFGRRLFFRQLAYRLIAPQHQSYSI